MFRVNLYAYLDRVRLFQRDARLYLFFTAAAGTAGGVFGLLFNFFILEQGLDEAFLGQMLSVNNFAALLAALPAGYLSDRLGRKRALLLAGVGSAVTVFLMILWPVPDVLLMLYGLAGAFQSLSYVTMAPFLMENSGETERTYLFSAGFGVQMLAVTAGYWIGGRLPGWLGDAAVYGPSLLFVAAVSLAALLPLLFIRTAAVEKQTDHLSPLRYAGRQRGLLAKLILPLIITTLGAGLFVPFMNVFFRERFNSSDAFIGSLFAMGSLAMALGLLLAPVLADRYGSIKSVIITQTLSIPFMAMLGFAPWLWLSAGAYLARLVLMNMNIPVYQSFAMEQVREEARGTASAVLNIGYSFGYALSPAISGRLQVSTGFGPIFGLAIAAYIAAVGMYWYFFARKAAPPVAPVGLGA